MRSRSTAKVTLASTGDSRARSAPVAVPAWARVCSVFPKASKWDSATVAVKDGVEAGKVFSALATPVSISSNTPARNIDVRMSEALVVETTSAGGGGGDSDAEFVFVFSDGALQAEEVSGGGATSPAGSSTQIQYNNAGVFGASSKLTWSGSALLADGTGTMYLGDFSGAGAGSFISIDDGTQILDAKANGGIRLKCYGAEAKFGDVDGDGNHAVIIVDDPNSRIVLGYAGTKVVIQADSLYAFDNGTGTFWQWQSVNGVWTGTDTTSAALP